MKAFLFLCLLAFMTCEKDIIDIGKCIYKAPKVQELIKDVMIAIITKDYSKLLPKIKESLPELIQIVIGCITDTNAIEAQPKLEGNDLYCTNKCAELSCRGKNYCDKNIFQACYNLCMKN